MGKLTAAPRNGESAVIKPRSKPYFQRAIDAAEALSLRQREVLVDVLQKRNSEARRLEIEAEIQESLIEYDQGKAKRGTLDDLMADLDS